MLVLLAGSAERQATWESGNQGSRLGCEWEWRRVLQVLYLDVRGEETGPETDGSETHRLSEERTTTPSSEEIEFIV